MTRYKPGSGIAKMWAAYESGGPPAATKIALSLNLADATIKTRIGGWDREKRNGGPAPKLPKAKKEGFGRIDKPFSQIGGIRVVWTKRPVRLIQKGDQCSEVRWLDTNSTQSLPNDQIKEVITKPQRRAK